MNPGLLDIPACFSSDRLLFRSYTPEDSAFYFQMLKDNWQYLAEFMPTELLPVKSKEDVELVFRKHQSEWDSRKLFIYGIWEKKTGTYIGETYLANPDWTVPRIEVGYFIVKPFTGNGFATEAARAATKLAFEHFQVSRVELQVVADNIASIRVAEKVGFVREGQFRQNHRKKDGTLVDTLWYGMLVADWKKTSGN